jgi:biotin operon repressor
MYEQTVKLRDDQKLAIVTSDGEFIKLTHKRPNNLPKGKSVHNLNDEFYKGYVSADIALMKILTPLEYRVVSMMKVRSKMNTNSLDPLSDESSLNEIAKELDIHRNSVSKIISKLRDIGVFANFEVTNQYGKRVKSWILNPVISFKGKVISDEIIGLFSDTMITKLATK